MKITLEDKILGILSKKYGFNYIKTIGKGGYGSVHLIQNKIGSFALKLIKLNKIFPEEKKEKFEKCLNEIRFEFEKSIELKSRFIIKSVKHFEHDKIEKDELFKDFPDNIKCFGLVMEKANCSDLNVLIHQIHNKKIFNIKMQDHPMFDQMNLIIIQFFVKQIALGLEFLNSSFLVHCDIKPENILLNYNFSIKISDFSLLKQIKTDEKFNLTHGTYCFESPEYFFTKNKEVDGKYAEKIDIFALGIIIYYMLYKKYEITKSDKDNNKLNYDFVIGKIKEQIHKIENDKKNGKLNKDLADLVISMINPDISKRASLKDILTNEWINSNEKEINRIHSINDGEISKLFIEFQKYQKETFNPKKRRKIQI